jgi:MHS family proline/betaine transporter-like MFS transporter
LVLTFATFAVGYLARPVGGLVIGRLGDTKGRKFALTLSTALMLIPLFVTTILPTYDQIGIWAPILLTLMRLMQGFSVGGEYSGALTALSESAAGEGRGRSVSLGLATAMGGNLLASLVVFATTVIWGQEALAQGTWRIPYALGFVLAVVAVVLLRKMKETESFEQAEQAGDTGRPARELLRNYPGATFIMLALATWSGVTVYTLISWMPSYLETVVGVTSSRADLTSALISVIYIVVILPVATLGDRRGRKSLMVAAVVGYVVLAIPAIYLLGNGATIAVLMSIAMLAVLQTFVDSTTTTEMTQLVPTRVRYTGLALTYSIGMIIGSFTPAVEEALVGSTGSILVPAFVLIGVSLLILPIIVIFPRYVKRAELEEEAALASA